MDPYSTLNVPTDADDNTVKKAYRRAAQENHPDKGGEKEVFHQIQLAYDVLSDPDRRAKYDQTGNCEDDVKPRDAAEGKLAELFASIIDKNEFTNDIIATCKFKTASVRQELVAKVSQLNVRKNKLTKQLNRIATKDAFNLYESILQEKINQLANQIAHFENENEILSNVMKLLEDYTDDTPEEVSDGWVRVS